MNISHRLTASRPELRTFHGRQLLRLTYLNPNRVSCVIVNSREKLLGSENCLSSRGVVKTTPREDKQFVAKQLLYGVMRMYEILFYKRAKVVPKVLQNSESQK